MPNLKPLLKFLAWVIGIVLVIGGVMRIFFIDVVVIGHNGMAPTLEAGDTVLMWRGATPDMGDIAMCVSPRSRTDLVMGRVVGKGGMEISVNRGQLIVAGSTPDRDYIGEMRYTDSVKQTTTTVRRAIEVLGNTGHQVFYNKNGHFTLRPHTVRIGRLYLLSDNRDYVGEDSRHYGPVFEGTCRGTMFMRLRPSPDSTNDLGHGWLDILH